jgi:hypothetical protein
VCTGTHTEQVRELHEDREAVFLRKTLQERSWESERFIERCSTAEHFRSSDYCHTCASVSVANLLERMCQFR